MKADSWDEIDKWTITLTNLYQHLGRGISFVAEWRKDTDDYKMQLNLNTVGWTSCYTFNLSDEQVLSMIEKAAEDMHEKASELNEMIIEYRKSQMENKTPKEPDPSDTMKILAKGPQFNPHEGEKT